MGGVSYAWDTLVPSPVWPSPKSQWTAIGLLQRSVVVALSAIGSPGKTSTPGWVASEREGATASKPPAATAVWPWGQTTWTFPAESAAAKGAPVPAGPAIAPPKDPPWGCTA